LLRGDTVRLRRYCLFASKAERNRKEKEKAFAVLRPEAVTATALWTMIQCSQGAGCLSLIQKPNFARGGAGISLNLRAACTALMPH
jgi:hypothetical protein